MFRKEGRTKIEAAIQGKHSEINKFYTKFRVSDANSDNDSDPNTDYTSDENETNKRTMFNRILRRPLSQIKEYSIQKSNKLRKMSIFGSREDTLSFTSVCDGVDGNSPRKKVVNSPSKNASVNTNSSKLKPCLLYTSPSPRDRG